MSQERDIRLYMFLRLAMLFSVLASTVLYQLSGALAPDVIARTHFVTFFTFLVTTGFLFLYEKARNVRYFLTSQVAYDILFTTVLIFYTGPFESVYSVFYLFNIIFAAILFRGTGALIAALMSGGLFIAVSWAEGFSATAEGSFTLLTTITAFVAIALLSGQLVEELRKSRQRVTRLEQLSEEIVDSLDSGLIGLDGGGAVLKINRTGRQLLGLPTGQEPIGRPFGEVFPAVGDVVTGGRSQVREIATQGGLRRMLVTRVELPETHSMIVFRDLTDVLDLEARLRRQEHLAGVGRLAAGVAHEIRNPVAAISGSAQILVDSGAQAGAGQSDAERDRLLTIILRESERVDRLVARLLRFTKPRVARLDAVDLEPLVRECVEAIRARNDLGADQVEIRLALGGDLVVRGNGDELAEVVTNLLVNALQALSGQGANDRKRIIVEGRRSGAQVELVLSDNGPGIPRELRGRVFDPFFTTKAEGSGLGLAQVHKIVRDLDGQVDLETEEGKGTSLRIRLPG